MCACSYLKSRLKCNVIQNSIDHVTAELGRTLAVVMVTSQVNGNTLFLGSSHPKTISLIKMKFGTID